MRVERIGKILKAGLLGAVLVLCSGSMFGTTAQAQGWGHRHGDRGGFTHFRQRGFVGPRVFVRPRVRAFGFRRVNPGIYLNYGYYGGYYDRYDGGPAYIAQQSGYRDGLDRGAEDARAGRSYDPNHSSHYRNSISAPYQEGFRQGYDDGYRQYSG